MPIDIRLFSFWIDVIANFQCNYTIFSIIFLGERSIWEEAHSPEVYDPQGSEHPGASGEAISEGGHRRFKTALEQNSYEDAKGMLREFEQWLRGINESAADSLLEAFEDILTLHRLKVPGVLRKTLTSTNPIESVFSTVRDCEGNIKRYRSTVHFNIRVPETFQ